MIWIFMLTVCLSLALIKLGALTVWVSIMATGLKFTLLIFAAGIITILIKRTFKK